MDVRTAIENFVEVYNREGSVVYPLYADELDWLEMPSGKRGGRAELFAALKEARDTVSDMKLKPLSIIADVEDGFLETEWSGRRRSDGRRRSRQRHQPAARTSALLAPRPDIPGRTEQLRTQAIRLAIPGVE